MSGYGVERRLAAILAADVVGYSRLLGADEAATLDRLRTLRRDVVDPLLAEHGGRVFKTTGDGLLVEFPSAVQALRCAIAIQERLRDATGLQLRIGLHQGDVVVVGDDLLGDGVNIAARIEPLAEPGGICISSRVREDATGKILLEVEDLGEPELKNIAQKVRIFRLRRSNETRQPLALPDKPSIAVLPFQNMSGDPEQEYFADGVVEDIITALSRMRWLFVIARNSSFTYKGRSVDVRQVGRELGVRYVLEGSVRRSSGRVRITGQLVEAASGAHVWADRFDGELGDIFDLQDRITESIVGAIAPNLERAELARVRDRPTENLDAYDLVLRSLQLYDAGTHDATTEAVSLLRRAIALDEHFVRAKAELARTESLAYIHGWLQPGWREEGLAMARAVTADHGDDAEALASAALALVYLGFDHDTALMATTRTIALNPNSTRVLLVAGRVFALSGEISRAMECYARVRRISPLDPRRGMLIGNTAEVHLMEGRYEAAIAAAAEALRENASFGACVRMTIAAMVALGRLDEARQQAARLMERNPSFRISQREFAREYRDPAIAALFLNGLRAAGVPE